jgi:Protein of unknown function (DUF1566)
MRLHSSIILAAALASSLAAFKPVWAECDAAKPAEPLASRFELRGDTVYDKSTNLTWMRCSYGQAWTERGECSGSVTLLDWDGAMALRSPGDAWRIPQKEELESIVATHCKRPAIDEAVFPETPSIQFWTSTGSSPSHAWVVFFRTGMSTWTYPRTAQFAVRLVRTGRSR